MDVQTFSIGILRPIDHMIVYHMLAVQSDRLVGSVCDRHDVDIRAVQDHRNIVLVVHRVMVTKMHNLEEVRMASVVIDVALFAYSQLRMLRRRLQLSCNDRSDDHYGLDPYTVNWSVCNLHG